MSQAVKAMLTGPRPFVRRGMAPILAQGLAFVPLVLAVGVAVACAVPVGLASAIPIATAVAMSLALPLPVAVVVVLRGRRRLLGLTAGW
jgi:hypothetical protein